MHLTPPVKLFYSYSHSDAKLRLQLEKHLAALKQQGLIEPWHDREIQAGSEWAGEIDKELSEADIILLLVSPDFLASGYCTAVEVKCAMARHEAGHARVIPVILRPCDWHNMPFGKLQALPKDGIPVSTWTNRDVAFLDVAKGLRKTVERLIASGWSGDGSSPSGTYEPDEANLRNQYEYDVFISYASSDAAYAFELADGLSKSLRVFIDKEGLSFGEPAYARIPEAQKASRATAALVSSGTYHSIFQRREIGDAMRLAARSESAHRLIPILIEDGTLVQRLPYALDTGKAIAGRQIAGTDTIAARLGRMLKGDTPSPTLKRNAWAPSWGPTAAAYVPVPSKLAGRQDLLNELLELLSSNVRVIAIDGMGGIGKTSVIASLFKKAETLNLFEASSWMTCREDDSDFESFLSVVAADTGSPVIADFEETRRSQQLLRHLSLVKTLMVVDAVEKVADDKLEKFLAFSRSVPAASKLILVCRHKLDIPGAVHRHVPPLDLESALDMIEQRIEELGWAEISRLPRDEWIPLHEALDGNPWFILSALAHIDHTGAGIDQVVTRLKKTQPSEDFAHIFGDTFKALTEHQKTVLCTLTLSRRPVSRETLQWITELEEDALSSAIETLYKVGLVERSGNPLSPSYRTHQLTNFYVDAQIDGRTYRLADLRYRYIEFYCAFAERHGGGLHNWDRYAQIDAEFDHVMHALSLVLEDFARDQSMTDHAVRFGMALTFYFELRGLWNKRIQCCKAALDAALARGRDVEAGWMCLSLGWTSAKQGAIAAATECADRATDLLKKGDDPRGLAYSTRLHGLIAFEDNDFARADELLSAAVEQIRPFGDHDRAIFLNSLANVQRMRGKFDDSGATLQEVLRLAENNTEPERIAGARRDLARLCLAQKQIDGAREHLLVALRASRQAGRTSAIADCLNGLALCCDLETEAAIARRYKSEATELFVGLGVFASPDFLDRHEV